MIHSFDDDRNGPGAETRSGSTWREARRVCGVLEGDQQFQIMWIERSLVGEGPARASYERGRATR